MDWSIHFPIFFKTEETKQAELDARRRSLFLNSKIMSMRVPIDLRGESDRISKWEIRKWSEYGGYRVRVWRVTVSLKKSHCRQILKIK